MNKMIIDVEYLKKLSRELEINKSTRLLSVRRSIEDGLRLDSKIRSKLSINNRLLENINNIISTNRALHESVEKSIRGFVPLESLKSSVKIEDFILLTNATSNSQTSTLDMQIDKYGIPGSILMNFDSDGTPWILKNLTPEQWAEFNRESINFENTPIKKRVYKFRFCKS